MTEEREEFPVSAFPAHIAAQVERIAQYLNVEPCLPACGFLAGASFAIGRGFDYALDPVLGSVTPSNLWITPVASSGAGKSSVREPLKIIEDIYKEQDLEWKGVRKPQLLCELRELEARAEELERKKLWDSAKEARRDAYDKQAEINAGRPAWLHENFTTEALSAAFSCPGRTAYACIVATEGRNIASNLVSNYADKSTEGFWLAGWSRVDANIRTRMNYHLTDSDGMIDGMQIASVFCLQPDKHEDLMRPPFSVSGWSQRRLFCIAQPRDYCSEDQSRTRAESLGLERPDLQRWNAWVRTMIAGAFSENGKRCTPDNDAVAILNDWYTLLNDRIKSGALGEMESHARRWGEIATRIALCLHCMEHGKNSADVKISGDTMTKGIAIMRWFANEMRASYWKVEVDGKTKKWEAIEKFALNRGAAGFAMRDLNRGSIGTKSELMPVIEKMIAERKLQVLPVSVTPGKTGPRPTRWIHSRAAERMVAREKNKMSA
jgi:hypothetical protein